MTHYTSVAHVFRCGTVLARETYSKVDSLISSVKTSFLKASSRVHLLKKMYPETIWSLKPILIEEVCDWKGLNILPNTVTALRIFCMPWTL